MHPLFFIYYQMTYGKRFSVLEKSSICELFKKSSVVVVRVPPLSPRGGGCPRGSPLDPPLVQSFQLTCLPSESSTRSTSEPQRRGNSRKIQKTSFVNRWFE